MHASTMVLLVTSPINVALNYWMIYPAGFGLLGSPLATGITYWLSFFLLCGMYSKEARNEIYEANFLSQFRVC